MRTLRDSWFMLRGELRGDKLSILFTLLFSVFMIGYLVFFTGMLINSSIGDKQQTAIVDFMLITMVPILGFTYTRRTFTYLSEDSYTKMLAYLHSLPIPAAVILCKRKIQAILTLGLNGILFFGLMYGIGREIRLEMSPVPYTVFALTWIGYGLAVTGLYIFIEFLFSGKMYCLFTFIIMIICAGVSALVKLTGGNLLFYSISCSKEYEFLSPLMWGSLLTGVVFMQLFSKWTIHRLKKRDLV
ncbi:hypothetical protein [Paenibacillus wynnii]|uniref:hypothetical protein n=1 Tax=Paenibacillus wynnii TaxID=268407 RepID=UPI002794E40D|nr:hypothetical protein [Paenibacillus wynnii]MDQ0196329.1 hypothetical protein [Paenibacillus wynnii]